MIGKNFQTFVIRSRNQIMGGFDVDRLVSIFFGSIERTFLFIRLIQLFLKRFKERNIFEGFRENGRERSLISKAEAGNLKNDANEIPRNTSDNHQGFQYLRQIVLVLTRMVLVLSFGSKQG